jgi:nucleoside-diphosphate-sugar epimerase
MPGIMRVGTKSECYDPGANGTDYWLGGGERTMNVLVTGASGFLGSHIVDRCLAQGDRVRVLVRPSSDCSYLQSLSNIDFAVGDITNRTAVSDASRDVDVVYHSAARVSDYGTRAQFWSQNVAATEHLLDAARSNGVKRFVFVSSPSVVMDGSDQIDIDERVPYPTRYLNLYSETKAAAERCVLEANGPTFTTCSLRPRAIWGPRDRTGYMPKLIAKLMTGRMPDLSAGKRVYASLCYCENAAAACTLAARADSVGGKAYFVTDGEKTDVWAFMAEVAALFGLPPISRSVSPSTLRAVVGAVEWLWRVPFLAHRYSPPISRYSMTLLTSTSTYDIRRANIDFGYQPTIDRATGLSRLKAWIDSIGGVSEYVRHVG